MFPHDKHNYEKAVLDFPQQLTQGIELAQPIKVAGTFTNAVICGMGASSIAAELISAATDSSAPIWAARGYHLPREVGDQTLVIVSSYSGNTEEALSCYEEAKKRERKIIGLSRNGVLEKRCQINHTLFIKYPPMWDGFQPRWGFGYSFAAISTVLENCGLLTGLTARLRAAAAKLDPEKFRAQGEKIADRLYQKEPAIYGPARLGYLARFWQMNFNEDAKVPAAWNYFPEVNHYETTGYTQGAANRVVVILRDPDEQSQIIKRQEITAKLLREKGVPVEFVDLPHGDIAARLFSGIVISMWTALYLSDLYKIDPAPTEMVEQLKKMLK